MYCCQSIDLKYSGSTVLTNKCIRNKDMQTVQQNKKTHKERDKKNIIYVNSTRNSIKMIKGAMCRGNSRPTV